MRIRILAFALLSGGIAMDRSHASNVLTLLDLGRPGLETVRAAAKSGDVEGAFDRLLAFYRARKGVVTADFDRSTRASRKGEALSGRDRKYADDALLHVFPGQKTYPSFARGDDIDWLTNPVKDREWIVQFHRFYWWPALAAAYWSTGDEKYAAEWVFELRHWIANNPRDAAHPDAWRSLEQGGRLVLFTKVFEAFVDSPSFTPEALCDLLGTVVMHGEYLKGHKSSKNWLLFESEGLIFAGAYFPELLAAKSWREEGIRRFAEEIRSQVFADGLHLELSLSYHIGAIDTFESAWSMAERNGCGGEFPPDYRATLERMVSAIMKVMLPDMSLPAFGDSWKGGSLRNFFRKWDVKFPRADFSFFSSNRASGKPPADLDFALGDGGFYAMRSGWDANATAMILKNGPDGGWHCQPDNLTFELFAFGRPLMADSGSYLYSGDDAGRAWFRRSASHQTVTLDGENTAYAPRLVKWTTAEGLTRLVVENASYSNLLHRRTVLFVDRRFFVIVDDLAGQAEGELRQHFQTAPGPIEPNEAAARVATVLPESGNLLLVSRCSVPVRLVEEEGWISVVYQKKEARPAFAFVAKKGSSVDRVRFVTVLAPFRGERPVVEIQTPSPADSRIDFHVGGKPFAFDVEAPPPR